MAQHGHIEMEHRYVSERDGLVNVGDLATWHTLRTGSVRVRVVGIDNGTTFYGRLGPDSSTADVQVTSRFHPVYRFGERLSALALDLTKR